ncbi:MAG TPA: hypothetical protein PJ982_16010, partial [Lacipirellulaceae bacterium]|nr:hypothetical protein [Lacipirellulaceae bacterium]
PPLPLAWRTFRANQRLRNLLAARVPGWLRSRLQTGSRVADDGVTLLIDYDEPTRMPWRHLFGHALYTRSRWLPLHCELVTSEFYGGPPSTDVVPFEP